MPAPALAFTVLDTEGNPLPGCFYVSKYGGTNEQDLAYRWVWDEGAGEWENGEDGNALVETVEGRYAVYLPDGTQIVDY